MNDYVAVEGQFLTEQQVAQRLGVSVANLRRRRLHHQPPAFIKIGRCVRYSTEDIIAFAVGCRVEPRSGDRAHKVEGSYV